MESETNTQTFTQDCFSDDDDVLGDDDDDKELTTKYDNRRNAVIYMLDSRKAMFLEDGLLEEKTPFMKCLKCIRNAMRAKIWASDKSLCSFIMLGTSKTENPLGLDHIYLAQTLIGLSAEHLLQLDDIAKRVEDLSFEREFGYADFSLADAFWLCSKLFNDSEKTMKLNKTIILFTNDDNPAKDNSNELDRIISSTKDMSENKILLDLVHFGENFNVNKLYKEIIQLCRQDMFYEIPDAVAQINDMVNFTSKKDYRHVTFSNIPFHITNHYKCEVSIHYLVRKVQPPYKIKLSKATNDIVTTKTQYFNSDTGEIVPKRNLVKSYSIGGKDISFTPKELKEIEMSSEKGLKLIGFKPASTVSLEYYVKPCPFIYPSHPEDAEKSSFFVALLTKCLERQVVPICTFCPRGGSTIQYVALLALEEELVKNKTQIIPSGFLAFFLPYADDVRDLDEKCVGKKRADEAEVKLAKKLINKLKFNYKPEQFPNPKLASHWSSIEALALNLKEPEPFTDSTKPDLDLMRSRTEDIVKEFKELVYGDEYDPEGTLPRSRPKPKPPKSDDISIVVDVGQVEDLLKSGEVNRLTSEMLKLFLRQVGEGKGLSKMKKSDLVEKACKYLKIPTP